MSGFAGFGPTGGGGAGGAALPSGASFASFDFVLTSDQLKLAFSQPPLIAPAPGPGKILIPYSMFATFMPGEESLRVTPAFGNATQSLVFIDGYMYGPGGISPSFSMGSGGQMADPNEVFLVGNNKQYIYMSSPYMSALPGDVDNRAIKIQLTAMGGDYGSYGPLLTMTVDTAGSGYSVGDIGFVNTWQTVEGIGVRGDGTATYVVDSVDEFGGITAASVTFGGSCYMLGGPYRTTVTTGAGDGSALFTATGVDTPTGNVGSLVGTVVCMLKDVS